MAKKTMLKKFNVAPEVVDQLAKRNEQERMEEMFEALQSERETPKRSAPAPSTTTLVDEEPSKQQQKKRKRGAADKVVVAPDILPRNQFLSGGGKKPAGVVFCATYDDASVLGKTIGKLHNFTDSYNMVFTDDGLEINFIDNSNVMMVRLVVPASSFLQYVDLTTPFTHGVMAAELKKFGDMCKKKHTLSYTRDQCGIESEPLMMRLMPADGRTKQQQEIREVFKPQHVNEEMVAPADPYQYKVRLPAKLFHDNIVAIVRRSTTVCLMLSKEAFEMIGVAETDLHPLSMHIPVKQCIEGEEDDEAQEVDEDADEDEEDECGIITRIGDRQSRVTMAQFRNYRLSATYLESAASFGGTHCKYVTLRMGVTMRDDGTGLQDEEPLHISFHMRPEAEQGAFNFDVWIAPIINE